MLLYIHVPFCRGKCAYCSFYSIPGADDPAITAYLDGLIGEIALWGRRFAQTSRLQTITSVYFGGGTPSLLGLAQLERIASALRDAFHFEPNLEWSLEANPESCADMGYLRGLLALGVNRLSLGLQSLDNAKLRVLGRRHAAGQGIKAYNLARSSGFENISLDLIWGLPAQRVPGWLRELETAMALRPEHFSCYGLTLEEQTPLAAAHASGKLELPAEQDQARMFLQGAELLESKGYLQYEISNFARLGFPCRHNQGYWQSEEYLGLGPGAVSTVGHRRWENPKDLGEYCRRVRSGQIGNAAIALSLDERIKEMVMLSLRTARGLNLEEYARLRGHDFLHRHRTLIRMLRQKNLIRVNSGYLRLTKSGMLVSNAILERF